MTNTPPARAEIRPAYRPDIDGLRAVAIISVVLNHASANLLPGGFIGVDIFFVISGYLISSLIFKELDLGHFSFADFYARRIRRIFPALLLMMIALWLAGWFLFTHSEFEQLGRHLLGGGAFVSNLVQWKEAGYFDVDARLKPLQHLWSLGIEEQYYIVWPVAVTLLWNRRLRNWMLAAILASFVFNVVRTPNHAVGAFFLPLGRTWELMIGSLLAWQDRYGKAEFLSRDRRIGTGAGVAQKDIAAWLAVALLAAGFALINSLSQFPGWWVLLPTLAAMLIIWAGESAWVNAWLLANPVMVFVGLISYPLYIWHWPILALMRIVGNSEPPPWAIATAIAFAVLLSIATYLLVERPLRRGKLPRNAVVGSLAVLMVAVCTIGYLSYAQILQTPGMAREAAAAAAAADAIRSDPKRNMGCDSLMSKESPVYKYCAIWGDPTLKKTFVIWGDSHAWAWTAGASLAAKNSGARLVEIQDRGCPPLVEVRRNLKVDGRDCSEISADIMAQIKTIAPQAIILASWWTLYVHGQHDQGVLIANTFVADVNSRGEANEQTANTAFMAKVPETVRRLAQFGRVVVIKTVPTLNSTIEIGLVRDPNGYEPTLAQYRAFEATPNMAIDLAARETPDVRVLDPATVLCTNKCHAILGGKRLYEDVTHLSDDGALLMEPTLWKLLQ